jgi:hypothetical protein
MELRKAGWGREELGKRPKGGPSQSGRRRAPEARDGYDAQVNQSAFGNGGLDTLEQAAL